METFHIPEVIHNIKIDYKDRLQERLLECHSCKHEWMPLSRQGIQVASLFLFKKFLEGFTRHLGKTYSNNKKESFL